MFPWRTVSGLNANIGYLIKRAVLLQIRDAANLSGLLHGELQRLDPVLNCAQLLMADWKGRPRCCQLIQQRTLPVAGGAKKSTAFFIWSLKYDFSGTWMERRDFVFSTAHVWQQLFNFQYSLKNNVRTTSGQRDEIWRQLAWPLSPGKLCCSVTALPGILPESANGKHRCFCHKHSNTVNTVELYTCCRFGSAVTLWTCSSWVRFLAATANASSNVFSISAAWIIIWQLIILFFFFTRKFKIVRTLFSFQKFSSILWKHTFIHLLKMYVDVEIVEHPGTNGNFHCAQSIITHLLCALRIAIFICRWWIFVWAAMLWSLTPEARGKKKWT